MLKTRSGRTQRRGIGFLSVYCIAFGAALTLFGPFTHRAAAQTMMGDFTGGVTDPKGNALQGAQVSIINDDTHGRRTTTTDNTGTYRANGFQPGTYTFDVTAPGFKEYVQPGVILTPAGVKPVNIQLSVGEVTQEVRITGQAPVISTESATVNTTLPQAYLDKPTTMDSQFNGIYQEFLAWAPGSSPEGNYQYGGTRPSFQQNNLEGMQNELLFMHTNVDAVASATLVEMAPAEYSRPTTTDASIKSGTNSLHASYLMDYYNNNCLNALNTPFSQSKRGPCSSVWRPYYGVGGPVYIPHVYDGRNKTFFYFGLKKNSAAPVTSFNAASFPTLAMQAGDFSNYPKIITDPTTGLPFPGNVIPANRISSVAHAVISADMGNHYTYVGGPNNFSNNVSSLGVYEVPVTMWDLRIDQNIGSRDILTGSWVNQLEVTDQTINSTFDPVGTTLGGPVLADDGTQKGNNLSIAETHVLSPNVVNELRLGFSRSFAGTIVTLANFSTPVYGDTTMAAWGLQGITNSPHLQGEPGITIDNWMSGGGTASFEWDTRPQGYDNVTIIKGKHTYKAGLALIKLMDDGPGLVVPGSNGPYWGSYTFTGQFTGEPFADFLLGVPGNFSRFTERPNIDRRMWEVGMYLQDDFRVTPRLTVSYGLRWNKFTVPYDKSGLYFNFDPSTNEIVVPSAQALAAISPAWPVSTFPVVLASQDHYPGGLINPSYSLQPRLGFAYRFNNKTVLRGGWGLYNGSVRFNALHLGGPYGLTESFSNTAVPANPSGAQYAWPDPFPSAAPVAHVLTASGTDKNYKDPYSLNSQISVERELIPNWGFRATYLVVLGKQLVWTENINSPVISTTPYTQASNPNPNLQSINLTQNGGRSIYNGLTFVLEHPWQHGLWSSISYTRAWNRADAEGGGLAYDDQNSYTPEYAYNLRRDWGNDGLDIPNDFIINTVADVPVGRGKYFASNANRLVNGVIGNWSTTLTYNWHSGYWFSPVESGIDPGNIGNFSNRRVDLIPGCNPDAGAHDKYGLWFNPACYTAPPNGQLGNVPPNSLGEPSMWLLIMNPFKEFPLGFREGAKLRIGAQITNILNHPPVGFPVTNLSNPVVGHITSNSYVRAVDFQGQREIFFSGKLIF